MATAQEFASYIKLNTGIELDPNDPHIDFLANSMCLEEPCFADFVERLAYKHDQFLIKNPTLIDCTDALFFDLTMHSASQISERGWKKTRIDLLFNAWTQCGTRDIAGTHAEKLKEPLTKLFALKGRAQDAVLSLVSLSPILWRHLNAILLEENYDSGPGGNKDSFEIVIHRHAPQLQHLYDKDCIREYYYNMCGGDSEFTPGISAMTHVLMGPHHHELSWTVALEVCWPEYLSLADKGSALLEVFSTLPLDPINPEAWRFWHVLCKYLKNNVLGQELIAALAEVKPAMSAAFESIWSVLDTLYEGKDQDQHKHAAEIYANIKKLPPELIIHTDFSMYQCQTNI